MGGGLELALSCDMRFMASGQGRMGLPEVKLGLMPAWGTTYRLPRMIGKQRALELMITGELLDAMEAHKIGIIDRVFSPEDFMKKTLEYAKGIAKGATYAMGKIKRCINKGIDKTLSEGLALERESQLEIFRTEDFKEGTQAFLEKREPKFKGR